MASQSAPWSIFTQGGGNGAAVTWAHDLLAAIGAPQSAGNVQFIYDWQKSEGGGGANNPLNQGPVPGQPQLTFTGSQYGGGAAGYVSVPAGIQGAADYLAMPAYAAVKSALMANNPAGAESALWASPWAGSHYGYGTAWNAAPLPGQASAITPAAGTGATLTSSLSPASIASGAVSGVASLLPGAGGLSGEAASLFSGVLAPFENWALRIAIGVAGAVLIITALILAGRHSDAGAQVEDTVALGAAA
jgi:hypothetical protein